MIQYLLPQIRRWILRMQAVVIGPGLGHDPHTLKAVCNIIEILATANIPCVIDAEGLRVFADPYRLRKDISRHLVMTPNHDEMRFLMRKLHEKDRPGYDSHTCPIYMFDVEGLVHQLPRGVTLVLKGSHDMIATRTQSISCPSGPGCPKRSGGQGDVLAGVIGGFLAWSHIFESDEFKTDIGVPQLLHPEIGMSAAAAGSFLTRHAAHEAFSIKGRSMTVSDILDAIPAVFRKYFEKPSAV
eukprot:GHVO01034529.1.p1 GENE.GHVO01034529.1~~GHVO01034529.1.p1  ORF type:complete len:241 (+),score=23.62 GHVO01034529.1:438-1160(+)